MEKETKRSSPARSSAGRAGQRTWTLRYFVFAFLIEVIGQSSCFVTYEASKGAVFRLALFINSNKFYTRRNKALENSSWIINWNKLRRVSMK